MRHLVVRAIAPIPLSLRMYVHLATKSETEDMSVENLKEYARRCATEPELKEKAMALGMSDMEGHMRHAESLGLDWTVDDMTAFRKEVLDSHGDIEGLDEEDLESVTGGAVTVTAVMLGAVGVGLAVVTGALAVGTADQW